MNYELTKLGISALNAMQETMAADRNDHVMLIAPTGSGKTIAFTLRMLREVEPGREGVQAVVLAPTRELVLQIAAVVRKAAGAGVRTVALYGGHPVREEVNELRVIPAVIVATPGRLLDHLHRRNVDIASARALVIDEYDKCLDMGFLPDMQRITRRMPALTLTLLTSATTNSIHNSQPSSIHNSQFIIHNFYPAGKETSVNAGSGSRPTQSAAPGAEASRLREPAAAAAQSHGGETPPPRTAPAGGEASRLPINMRSPEHPNGGETPPPRSNYELCIVNCELPEVNCELDKLPALERLLRAVQPERAIVFVNHRESAERVYHHLRRAGADAVLYHGALDQQQRKMAVELLANGSRPIMVATDLAARGLDIPAIDAVIHYHLPIDRETWIHRNGRTARQGATGTVYAMVSSPEEKDTLIHNSPNSIHNSQFIIHNCPAGESSVKVGASSRSPQSDAPGAEASRLREPAPTLPPRRGGVPASPTQPGPARSHGGETPPPRGVAPADMGRAGARPYTDSPNSESCIMHYELPEVDGELNPLPRGKMATLYINAGKKEKISKGDVAGYVMQKGGLDRDQVGRIAVDDHYSLVAVPAAEARRVVAALRPHKLKSRRVKVTLVE